MKNTILVFVLSIALCSCKKSENTPEKKNPDNIKIEISCSNQCLIDIDTATTRTSTYAIFEHRKTITNYSRTYFANKGASIHTLLDPLKFGTLSIKITYEGKVMYNETREDDKQWRTEGYL